MIIDAGKCGLLLQSDTAHDSTTFTDRSQHGHVVTPTGDVRHVSDSDAYGATAIRFDGSGDFLTVAADNSLTFPDTFTFAFRIKPTYSDLGVIFNGRSSSSTGIIHRSYQNRQGIFYGGGVKQQTSDVVYTPDVWQHWAIVRDVTDLVTMYIDGASVGTIEWAEVTINAAITALIIGTYTGEYLDADLKEMLMTSEVLWTAPFAPPSGPYSLAKPEIYFNFTQILPYILTLSTTQQISTARRVDYAMKLIVSRARNSYLSTGVIINTADPCYRQFEIPIVGYAGAFLVFEQVFSLLGHAAALQFSEVWYQRGYDEARLEFREVITAELEEELQQLQFSVTVAGTRVAVESCDLDRSGVATVADLTLRNFSDYNNKNVGDPVSVWWLGIEYKLILENKPLSESISQGQKDIPYIFQCVSRTAQLSEQINPSLVASRVTGSFSEETMVSELLDFIMEGISPWSLGVSDFPVGAIEFEDSDRGTALRQLFPGGDTLNQEWVVNTAPDGMLTVNRFFGDIVPELLSASEPDKTVNCSSKSLTPPTGLLYTQVSISNYAQNAGAAGLRIEIIDNGDGTGFIHGNSVPWTGNLTLDHSALSGLIVQKVGIEEVEFTDEAVEISDYSGSLSKPVYSVVSVDWLNNDSLDPVTADESGQLKTETAPGNSVGNFTAMTKWIKWKYSNDRDQVAQVVLKYGDQ